MPVRKLAVVFICLMEFIRAGGKFAFELKRKAEFACIAQTPEGGRLLDEYRRRWREQSS
jgi:hypothetical protein